MSKKIVSIEAGIWWTKVCLVDYKKTSPKVYKAFAFRTPEHAIEDGYIRDKENFEVVLMKELQRHGIKEREAIFILSSSKIVTREVVIPAVKDNKITAIIDAQIEEYFPMDVSDYVISYNKMGQTEQDGKKQLKLLLVAVPDNLLSNYYSFADHAGLKIETFDYIGNSAVQFMKNGLSGNAVVVQLEEQATVISILVNKKVAFQRVTPYGFGTSLSNVLDHEILGAKDEYEAFEFLLKNDILFKLPNVESTGEISELEADSRRELLEEACEDLKESLSYHLRVVNTALDYYQNQLKGELHGKLYLIGDGSRLGGIQRLFERELPLPVHNLDYSTFLDVKKFLQEDGAVTSVGFLSVAGAAVHPVDVKSKERKATESKKSSTHSAYVILAASVLLSLVLILASSIRRLNAVSEQKDLQQKISDLSYIEKVYDENEAARQSEGAYEAIDNATKTENEQFLSLLAALEKQLPKKVTVQSMEIMDNAITLNLSSTQKLEAARLLMNLKEISFLKDISIPSIAESENDSGRKTWEYTIMVNYKTPEEVALEEITEAAGQETAEDTQ